VTPIRQTDGGKGTVAVSKLVYVNLNADQDASCVKALAEAEQTFMQMALLVDHVGKDGQTISVPVRGTLTITREEIRFTPTVAAEKDISCSFLDPYPLLFHAPSDPSIIVWCDGRDVDAAAEGSSDRYGESYVLQCPDAPTADKILVLYRLFFCLATPQVLELLFPGQSEGNGASDEDDTSTPMGILQQRATSATEVAELESRLNGLFARWRMKLKANEEDQGLLSEEERELCRKLERAASSHSMLAILEEALFYTQSALGQITDTAPCRKTLNAAGEPRVLPFLLPQYPGVQF
jgi:hypothetical protein